MVDGIDGLLPHLHARDVTFVLVSQAPLEKLQAYKHRMGWSIPWASAARSDFNVDLGYSSSKEQTREWAEPMLEQLPPIAARNANESGTDVVGYLTELFGFSAFALEEGTVYQTYSTTGRGVEFLMGYYPILDRAPKGRDEGDGFSSGSIATTSTARSGCRALVPEGLRALAISDCHTAARDQRNGSEYSTVALERLSEAKAHRRSNALRVQQK